MPTTYPAARQDDRGYLTECNSRSSNRVYYVVQIFTTGVRGKEVQGMGKQTGGKGPGGSIALLAATVAAVIVLLLALRTTAHAGAASGRRRGGRRKGTRRGSPARAPAYAGD